jgi:intracellular sulfur oxidation DsrE/DsrF family protein
MTENKNDRRGFLGTILGAAAAFGLGSINTAKAEELITTSAEPAEALFKNLKGKHKLVYDMIAYRGGSGLSWCKAFLDSNNQTGTPDGQLTAMMVLRSAGIGFALNDSMWEKYKLGEIYKLDDPATKAPAIKNQFFNVTKDDLIEPESSMDNLQKRGVIFCVCRLALKGNAEHIAEKMELKKEDVENDFLANLVAGVHPVPSGMWALSRAQENGCGFVFVG